MLVAPAMLPEGLSGGVGRALAQAQCGAAAAGGTVICNGDGVPATDASPYPNGIFYSTQDVKLIIDGTAGALTVQSATPIIGVANRGGAGIGTREVQINGDVTIRTQADAFGTPISGVQAYQQQGGNALVVQNGGAIISLGNGAFGMVARTDGAGTATAIQNGGAISTNGTGGAGVALFAEAYGAGSTVATQNDGSITTNGSHAVYALARGSGNATATQTGGTITSLSTMFTNGGIVAQTLGIGDARATQTGGTIVTNGSGGAVGAVASGNGNATAEQLGGSVTANGANASGIAASAMGSGTVTVVQAVGLTASATGANSNGIAASARGTGRYVVSVAGTAIGGSGANAAAVHTTGNAGGTIDIAAGARLDGSRSGFAVIDEAGAVVLTTSGILTGGIQTRAGNDTINLVGGAVAGAVDAGVDDDSFNWTGGTLTGGFYGRNGSDTAVISTSGYNGSQVLDGGDDVSVADGWVDRLTFKGITAAALGANIVNWESVTLDATNLTISDGALTVGSDPGMGLFLTNRSTLDGLNAFALTGNMMIDSTSTFTATGGGAGVYSVSGALANAGTIAMQDGSAGDVLRVGGNYVSNGGRLLIDTFLGADASATDRLVIQGNSAIGTGATSLLVANTTGGGALTTSDGIKVVQVDGTSAAGTFVLGNRVAAGAYEYLLYHNGVGANAADGDWYLRSTTTPTTPPTTTTTMPNTPASTAEPDPVQLPNYRVEVPVDMAVPALASRFGLAMLGTYHDRAGEDYADPAAPPAKPIWCKDPARGFRCTPTAQQNSYYADAATGEGERRKALWARIFGETGSVGYSGKGVISRYSSFEKHGPSYNFGLAGAQIGMDLYRKLNDNGTRDIAGVYLGAGRIDSEVKAVYGGKAGSASMDGYSLGAYWTRKGASGWYVDAVVQGTWYDRIRANSVLGEELKTDGWGFTASLEAGYPVALGAGWAIEPQAQLIYQRVSIDGGADSFGRVKYDDTDTLYGRLGARLTKGWTLEDGRNVTVWGRANLWHAFGADAKTTFSNLAGANPVTLNTALGGTWAQFGLGVSGQITKSTSVFASGDYNLALGNANGHSLSGRLGLKVVW